jgi:nucleotide-binding universal stress UspA family protein
MFKKILVPIDPSEVEFGREAVRYARGLAEPSRAAVRLLAVMPVMGGYVTEYLPADFEEKAEQQALQDMRKLAADAGIPEAQVEVGSRLGGVYHEVVDDAADWGADLIVVSSHRPTMSTYLIGSNAARIVRHAPCSVMVVRPPA